MKNNSYAVALFSLAKEDKEIFLCQKAFQAFMENYNQEFKAFFTSPTIKADVKKNVIAKAFDNTYLNFIYFLNVVIDNNRELMIEEIYSDFLRLIDEEMKIKRLTVISNEALTENDKMRIKDSLTKRFLGYHLEIENKVDESIIAGYQIYNGNELLDLSLKKEIVMLKSEL